MQPKTKMDFANILKSQREN